MFKVHDLIIPALALPRSPLRGVTVQSWERGEAEQGVGRGSNDVGKQKVLLCKEVSKRHEVHIPRALSISLKQLLRVEPVATCGTKGEKVESANLAIAPPPDGH